MIIFTDENIPPHLAPGFQLIQGPESMKTGIPLEVKHLPDHFGYGSKDVDWIPELGRIKACVITRDIHLNRRKHEIELLKKYSLGVFFLKALTKKSGLSVWQMVEVLARNWPEITKIAVDEERPFGYEVYVTGKLKKIF
jgi:hypothetical protein